MIKILGDISVRSLASLDLENLIIRVEADDLVAYFDFEEVVVLDKSDVVGSLHKLNPPESITFPKLSFSGWIGFFGYEFLAANFGLSLNSRVDLDVPDGWFGRPQSLIRFGSNYLAVESQIPAREEEIRKLVNSYDFSIKEETKEEGTSGSLECNLDYVEYNKIFDLAREAILDGETYQIKISQRFKRTTHINPLLTFEELLASNPAPEGFLLQTEHFSLISCSPEVVIDKKGSSITTRPIGGTYERDRHASNQSIIEGFLSDPKEVAEHNMLVDLERNDLSTICIPGSVRIERFREVESYSHLHHLVSTITGTIEGDPNLEEILRAMLPGGSITGCPKARTMEWIDRLEPCFRGPYTGSFGIISDDRSMHLNLIIRCMLVLDGQCYVQAGGGIVVDSTARYEFNENRIKAQALLDLLT